MTQPWTLLATETTPEGKLELRRRGDKDFVLTIDGRVLMNSASQRSEEALATLGCARVELDHLIAYRPEQLRLALQPADQPRLEAAVSEALATARVHGIETTAEALLRPRGLSTPPPAPGVGLAAAPCLKAWHHLVIQADGRVSPCCVLAGEGGPIRDSGPIGSGGAGGSVGAAWAHDPFLQTVRTSMLQKTPLPRCRECSENILVHERAIRDRLPNSPQVAGQGAGQAATLSEPA